MIQALFVGLILGIAVAVPPGPLSLTVFTQALDRGTRAAVSVAAGGMVSEFVFALMGFMGIGLAADAGLGTPLRLVSCLVILILGAKYTFARVRVENGSAASAVRTHGNGILLGMLLCATTPTIAVAYLVFAGFVHTLGLFSPTAENSVAAALGATAGSLLWLLLMVHAIRQTRKSLDSSVLRSVTRGLGGLLLAIGLYYTFDFFRFTTGQ